MKCLCFWIQKNLPLFVALKLSLILAPQIHCFVQMVTIRWDRDSKDGGVMLIIRDSFPYRVIKIPNEFVNIELVCVDLSNHSTYKIIVYNRSGGSY